MVSRGEDLKVGWGGGFARPLSLHPCELLGSSHEPGLLGTTFPGCGIQTSPRTQTRPPPGRGVSSWLAPTAGTICFPNSLLILLIFLHLTCLHAWRLPLAPFQPDLQSPSWERLQEQLHLAPGRLGFSLPGCQDAGLQMQPAVRGACLLFCLFGFFFPVFFLLFPTKLFLLCLVFFLHPPPPPHTHTQPNFSTGLLAWAALSSM